jgi:hypothetical protein
LSARYDHNMEMQMNVHITRGALALAGLAMALLARPISAGAAQDHRPKQVAEKVVPIYNASASQRGRLYLLENRAPSNANAAENFQDAFNINY